MAPKVARPGSLDAIAVENCEMRKLLQRTVHRPHGKEAFFLHDADVPHVRGPIEPYLHSRSPVSYR